VLDRTNLQTRQRQQSNGRQNIDSQRRIEQEIVQFLKNIITTLTSEKSPILYIALYLAKGSDGFGWRDIAALPSSTPDDRLASFCTQCYDLVQLET
jgi:hypothetical protein